MALTLISTHTASASATLDITSGIDSTYDSYEFHFVNMHVGTNGAILQFQVNASDDTGGGFDTSLITSTSFHTWHREADTSYGLGYTGGDFDLAQQALFQRISLNSGTDDKQSLSGVLTLYAPSSTTYVKHFTSMTETYAYDADEPGGLYGSQSQFAAGYINQTLAIPEIRFKMTSGNIDAGTIKMFGVS